MPSGRGGLGLAPVVIAATRAGWSEAARSAGMSTGVEREKRNVMDFARTFQDLINRPTGTDLVIALAVSAGLLLIGLVLMLAKRRWIGATLGMVGLLASLVVLTIVDQQTVTHRDSASVTVIRPRYRERVRSMASWSRVTLPMATIAVLTIGWIAARRQLRKSVPGILKAGRMHLFLKEYEAAVAEFARAIRISPYLAEAYSGRGAAYSGLGDVERALADYEQAIQLDPRLIPALIQRARLRTESGDLDGALDDLTRVMEIHPSDPELYLHRGVCFLKQGLLSDATADFHRVLKLTNHSDFAEPAKSYLMDLEKIAAGLPLSPPSPDTNGVPDAAGLPAPEPNNPIR